MNEHNAEAQRLFADAQTLHRQGRLAEAEASYRQAIALDGSHHAAKEWLGALCLQQGNTAEAVDLLGEAAKLCPGNAAYHDNLAAALLRAGKPAEAIAALERAIAATPGASVPRKKLGELLLKLGHPAKAMAVLETAVALDPQLKAVCRDTSLFPAEEDRCNAVLENSGHILARYPNYAPAHYGMAHALLSLGRIAEARRAAEKALVLDPTVPSYYHVLIHTGGPQENKAAVSALEQLAQNENELDGQDRATLHFLLAKAYDDEKRFAEAFSHLQQANALKRGMTAYDEAHELGRMQAIAAAFPAGRMAALRGRGHPSELPVFILGMPRSGTTLVEQILASHPEVHGAGEITWLSELVAEEMDFPADAEALTAERLRQLGERYAVKLAAIDARAKRITDKLPYNFLYAGLIHLALPGARIIHVRRDPLDTCFSCYAQNFAGEVGFAYELGELGRYYRAYEALMAHWRQVLPDGAMLEVQYETLVNGLAGEARRIVDFCGLGWDENCLNFHKARRAVATASLHQVRQPIYQSAVGRAQAYAAHLAPLREALGLS